MLLKSSAVSEDIAYLLALEHRVTLTEDEQKSLKNYALGLDGEELFYDKIKDLDAAVVWNLTLYHYDYVQYDFLVVSKGRVYHFDVKNYSGQYRFEKEVLKHLYTRKVIKSPISQLERAHQILQQFIRDNGFYHQVVSRVVFINEELMLKAFDGDDRIILAGQVQQMLRYMHKHCLMNEQDLQLARVLHKAQVIYPYTSFNRRAVDGLDTSLRCLKCRQLVPAPMKKRYFGCSCGHRMKREEVALHNLYELEQLKGDRFSKSEAMQWSGYSNTAIKKLLSQYAMRNGNNKASKYVMKDKESVLRPVSRTALKVTGRKPEMRPISRTAPKVTGRKPEKS